MDPRAIVGLAVDTIAGGVPDNIRADYLSCYDGDRFVESMRYVPGIPRSCPHSPSCCRTSLPRSRSLTAATTESSRSPTEFLDERLPTSRLAIIDAGHFVWEEAPAEYASIILDSITAAGTRDRGTAS